MIVNRGQHLLCTLLISAATMAQAADTKGEMPTAVPVPNAEVIVVTGHLPGPAMFRVSDGDEHVLWVFVTVSPIPKDMVWESLRVEKVIAEAEEYIEPPNSDIPLYPLVVSISPLAMINPVGYVRMNRLIDRLEQNPGGKLLDEVLPPELYRRFDALRKKYDPDNKALDELQPIFAIGALEAPALEQNGLVANGGIGKRIDRLVNKNRKLKRMPTRVNMGGGGRMEDRLSAFMSSMPLDVQIACMDHALSRLESDIPGMISRANSWAQGHVHEFRGLPARRAATDPCFNSLLLSSEKDMLAVIGKQSDEKWLNTAEAALSANATTFAVLGMENAVGENGLLAKLRAKGYSIREPD